MCVKVQTINLCAFSKYCFQKTAGTFEAASFFLKLFRMVEQTMA